MRSERGRLVFIHLPLWFYLNIFKWYASLMMVNVYSAFCLSIPTWWCIIYIIPFMVARRREEQEQQHSSSSRNEWHLLERRDLSMLLLLLLQLTWALYGWSPSAADVGDISNQQHDALLGAYTLTHTQKKKKWDRKMRIHAAIIILIAPSLVSLSNPPPLRRSVRLAVGLMSITLRLRLLHATLRFISRMIYLVKTHRLAIKADSHIFDGVFFSLFFFFSA